LWGYKEPEKKKRKWVQDLVGREKKTE
jgi:hypothetical protein